MRSPRAFILILISFLMIFASCSDLEDKDINQITAPVHPITGKWVWAPELDGIDVQSTKASQHYALSFNGLGLLKVEYYFIDKPREIDPDFHLYKEVDALSADFYRLAHESNRELTLRLSIVGEKHAKLRCFYSDNPSAPSVMLIDPPMICFRRSFKKVE